MMREATNERSLRRTLLLASACTLAAVHTVPCAAQPPLQFDVASIKPAPPGSGNTTMKFSRRFRHRSTAQCPDSTGIRSQGFPGPRTKPNGPTPNPTKPTMSSPSPRPVLRSIATN